MDALTGFGENMPRTNDFYHQLRAKGVTTQGRHSIKPSWSYDPLVDASIPDEPNLFPDPL